MSEIRAETIVEAYLIYDDINQYPNVIVKSVAQESSLPTCWCIYTLMVLHFEGTSSDSQGTQGYKSSPLWDSSHTLSEE